MHIFGVYHAYVLLTALPPHLWSVTVCTSVVHNRPHAPNPPSPQYLLFKDRSSRTTSLASDWRDVELDVAKLQAFGGLPAIAERFR